MGKLLMESIRIADINDRYDIEKLIKVMLGDNDPDKIAKLLVDNFFLNNSYMVYVVEVLNLVKGLVLQNLIHLKAEMVSRNCVFRN